MADKKKNQPPAGEGKKQSPTRGESGKLAKRSMVVQSSGQRQNIQTGDEEQSYRENPSGRKNNPKRAKAGR
jgi:hypothetical protein